MWWISNHNWLRSGSLQCPPSLVRCPQDLNLCNGSQVDYLPLQYNSIYCAMFAYFSSSYPGSKSLPIVSSCSFRFIVTRFQGKQRMQQYWKLSNALHPLVFKALKQFLGMQRLQVSNAGFPIPVAWKAMHAGINKCYEMPCRPVNCDKKADRLFYCNKKNRLENNASSD